MGEWKSIEDEMPEEVVDVLIWYERDAWRSNGKQYRKKEMGIGHHVDGRWHVDGCSRVKALFWMHLPNPPKGRR